MKFCCELVLTGVLLMSPVALTLGAWLEEGMEAGPGLQRKGEGLEASPCVSERGVTALSARRAL